jgi:copper chaperone NosL
MMRRAVLLLAVAALALAACSESDGPIEPVWGKQPCAHCAMILSDRRFGAQLVTGKGERLFYDDIGCMVLDIDQRGLRAPRAWVRDAQTGLWLGAPTARYVAGAHTPMDFGFEARANDGVAWDEVRGAVVAKARRDM